MTTPLRILWASNSPWVPSGYGKQTKHALDILSDLQHDGAPIEDVAHYSIYGLQGGKTRLGGRTVYGNPIGFKDPWGGQMMVPYYKDAEANLLITLHDAWVFPPSLVTDTNWLPYYPVDHEPIPQAVQGMIQNAWGRLAMSRYGVEQSERLAMSPVDYAPHCYDANLIKALPEAGQAAAREWFGFEPDTFMFGMVAHNLGTPARKAFAEVFAAFQKVVEREPKARLYVHAEARPGGVGVDLVQLAALYGIDKYVTYPDPDKMWTHFATDVEMNVLYNALDCLVSPSYGEGFGVPIIEAQGAGTPVITQDCTAMTEITHSGWCIPKGRAWMSPQMAYQWMPEPEQIAEAMLDCMGRDEARTADMSIEAEEWARANYDIRAVRDEHWKPLVYALAERLDKPDILQERRGER